MIQLLLCRHGQSEADLEPERMEGNADFPLTALGHRQAEALARWVAERYRVDRLIASPLKRAQQTAQALARALDLPVDKEERLAERSLGLLAGLTVEEADRRYPRPPFIGVNHRPPEGESYLDHFRRVADWYYEVYYNLALDGKTLLVVSHGGTINCLLDAALGLPPLAEVTFSCADTCLHELLIEPRGHVRVKRLNSTAHLEGLS